MLNRVELDKLASTVMLPPAVTLASDLLFPGPSTCDLILVKLVSIVTKIKYSPDFLVITCCDPDL